MAVLALVRKPEEISQVLSWSAHFAAARETRVVVACWRYSPLVNLQSDANDLSLVASVRDWVAHCDPNSAVAGLESSGDLEVHAFTHPSDSAGAIQMAANHKAVMIVAAAEDSTGASGSTYATNPLLRDSPLHTVILFGGSGRSTNPKRVFVGVTDSAHDNASVLLSRFLAERCHSQVTVARGELDYEQAAVEVGRRELQQLLRNAGAEDTPGIECRVLPKGDFEAAIGVMEDHDLVLAAANATRVSMAVEGTHRPTIAVVKRAPTLRPWRRKVADPEWNAHLSPADYADLMEGLRRGSKLSVDFMVMLGLATVVASMGLLQNSTAVVIGSMLLAPLMTPMLGCGLALAQANPKLGNAALRSVAVGLLCTLGISFLLGMLTPGSELTPEIYARGEPNALDLIVALSSAAAAAYALARPNLVGSIAGVAIATALVPPLCSVGLSLAYVELGNARGAALLFVTNFVAIVLGAALTFRTMGVVAAEVEFRNRFWVFRVATALCLAAILLFVPLQLSLLQGLVEGKPQPLTYPLARIVTEAIESHVSKNPDVTLISAGQPSAPSDHADVVLILGTPTELDSAYADELIQIVRDSMQDPKLAVEVHCLRELWQQTGK